jgi:predicted HicB family RNase H-like nuclease
MTSERVFGSKVPRPNLAFNLRMPPNLKLALVAEAQANGRSLNSEIVYRLQKSLTTYRQL